MQRGHDRRRGGSWRLAAAVLALMVSDGGATLAVAQQQVVAPQPTVPEVFTLMGQYVRVAYNNRGFVTLGYRVAQQSVGEEWMLLEVGVTIRGGDDYTLKREHLKVKTPDGSTIGLATQRDYAEAGFLPALEMRAKVVRDSINYFPAEVSRPCSIHFFANLGQGGRQLAYDEVELSRQRACVGRLYFKVPGRIKVGQHWLIVDFGDSEVQVPFRILTKEEKKQFEKSWQDIKKAHDATLQ